MSTLVRDRLYDDTQSVQPADMPANGSTVDLSAAGKTYRMTEIFPAASRWATIWMWFSISGGGGRVRRWRVVESEEGALPAVPHRRSLTPTISQWPRVPVLLRCRRPLPPRRKTQPSLRSVSRWSSKAQRPHYPQPSHRPLAQQLHRLLLQHSRHSRPPQRSPASSAALADSSGASLAQNLNPASESFSRYLLGKQGLHWARLPLNDPARPVHLKLEVALQR